MALKSGLYQPSEGVSLPRKIRASHRKHRPAVITQEGGTTTPTLNDSKEIPYRYISPLNGP